MAPTFQFQMAGARVDDRIIASLAAALSVALTMIVCREFPLLNSDLPAIIAPLGASAVMVFVVPSSPLAQPWRVVGGNVVSTLVGVAAFKAIPEPTLAAGAAVCGAILVMSLLRCLHPPGGAAALTSVIGSASIHDAGYAFAFAPVAINSITLVTLAMVIHRWTGHSYPHRQVDEGEILTGGSAAGFERADLDRALDDLHETFDISREDLEQILWRAEIHAENRRNAAAQP